MDALGHILIVDDHDLMRLALRELFESAGYEVTEAICGHEALEALSRGPLPHVIVLDIQMPGMGGVEFRAQQLRDECFAHIPVIVHSSMNISDDRLQAHAYLPKGIDSDAILETVQRVLAGSPPKKSS